MSESKAGKEDSADTSAECPICYETFQPPKVSQRMLSCGHSFCHDCLVKCLVASQDNSHFGNCLICPVCRFVTFLCRKDPCWPSKTTPIDPSLELPLSPSLLPYAVSMATSNTLEIPDHFLMPQHGPSSHQNVCGCPITNSVGHPGGLERESHIFMITQCGMPMIEVNYDVITQDRHVEAPGSLVSRFFKSPIFLVLFLISAVSALGAAIPWIMNPMNIFPN